MTIIYEEFFQLQEILALSPTLLHAPILFNLDSGQLYAEVMDRLAAPPDVGVESAFSGRSPLSGHGQLTGMYIHLLDLWAHEMNLVPDRNFVQWFRTLGIELSPPEYPVINLNFVKSNDAFVSGIDVTIPIGTEITSNRDTSLTAITTATVEITGSNQSVDVPARLNKIGPIGSDVSVGEFTVFPRLFGSLISSVSNTDIIESGREKETLESAMLRGRSLIQTGLRCTTARDYYTTALNLGATKANVIPGLQYPDVDYYSDLITLAVYPGKVSTIVQSTIQNLITANVRLDVVAADIIPIDGDIDVKIVPNLQNSRAFDVAATAIQQNVNPPNGSWADRAFPSTVATALENQPSSIYAVPRIKLKHALTNQPIEEINAKPWQLFEIQGSINFNWLR